MNDIIFNARSDKADTWFSKLIENVNFLAQQYAIQKMYNITNITKA